MESLIQRMNGLIRNISLQNINSHISQLSALLNLSSKSGIRFSEIVDYDSALTSFTAEKFPEWNQNAIRKEIELLVKQGKYEKAAKLREHLLALSQEMQRQFRLEKYGTEDWFIEISEKEFMFLPTKIEVIDNLFSDDVLRDNS